MLLSWSLSSGVWDPVKCRSQVCEAAGPVRDDSSGIWVWRPGEQTWAAAGLLWFHSRYSVRFSVNTILAGLTPSGVTDVASVRSAVVTFWWRFHMEHLKGKWWASWWEAAWRGRARPPGVWAAGQVRVHTCLCAPGQCPGLSVSSLKKGKHKAYPTWAVGGFRDSRERMSMKAHYNLEVVYRSKVMEDGGRKRDVKSR